MTGFPVTVEFPVAWADLDLFQHVNNVEHFRYFQAARIAYFDRIGLMQMHRETNIGPILHSTNARFHKELGYPDTVIVGASISEMRTTSFVLDYKVESQEVGVVSEGSSVNLVFDFNTKKKVPIPDSIKEEISKLEQRKF